MPDAQFDLIESYDTAPQSDWFHACRDARKPYVVVRTAESTADVMWDYVTLPASCDEILITNAGLLKEQAIAIFERHASVDSSVRVKSTVVFFDNLSIPRAKLAANELYALIESLVEGRGHKPVEGAQQSAKPPGLAAAGRQWSETSMPQHAISGPDLRFERGAAPSNTQAASRALRPIADAPEAGWTRH